MLKELKSLQHPVVKHLVKLREKKEYRAQCNTALLSGIKLIEELSHTHRFKKILIEENYTPTFSFDTEQLFVVHPSILKKITNLIQPEPLAAEIDLPTEEDFSQKQYLLILDGISDPGNMGTLLRTALALGWEGVLITPKSTDPYNEKALRAAKGATFKIPLKNGTWADIDAFLTSGKWNILAADVDGIPMAQTSIAPPVALALGNEAKGLSDRIKMHASKIAIPMQKEMQSLNVACAGAILMQFLKSNR